MIVKHSKNARKIAINDMKRLNIATYLLKEYHKRRMRQALINK